MDDPNRLFAFSDIPARASARQPRSRLDAVEEARVMGTWTLDKLQVFDLYLKLYRRVAGGGAYIDAFAGEGRITVKGEEREGSASTALRAGAFRQLYFMEIDSERNRRLNVHLKRTFSTRAFAKCDIFEPGDANVQIPELLASGRIDPARPCFALLDPDSTQLAWSTVETLAGFKPLDPGTGQCKVEPLGAVQHTPGHAAALAGRPTTAQPQRGKAPSRHGWT